jgi:hypothetical protein
MRSRDPAHWRYFVIPLQSHFEVELGAIGDLVVRDHKSRIIASLLRLGGWRIGDVPQRARIKIEASQEEIAAVTNVARMTAGAVLHDWRRPVRSIQATGRLRCSPRGGFGPCW